MIEVPVLDMTGKQVGSEQVDPATLGGKVRTALLKQAVVAYRANRRQGTVKQKNRAEVDGANRKLYRQKGTGNARMGPVRTPTRRGGGRAFPRRPSDFSLDLPKRMRRAARDSALLAKMESGNALILDQLKLDQPRTKLMYGVLTALKVADGCLLAVAAPDETVWRAGRNIATLEIKPVGQINAYDLLRSRKVVFVRDAFLSLVSGPGSKATA
jgi:large subunit ribosomal protein L4